jgi:hypothetical protein
VLVVDPNHIQLSNKPPLALDPTVTNPASTQTLTVPQAVDFELGAIDSTGNNEIYLPANGFKNGDTVTYTQVSGDDITGLTSSVQYVVQTIDGNNFQLPQPGTSDVIPLVQDPSTGTYTFTDGTNTQTLILALVDATANTITLAGNSFTNGESIVYNSLSSEDIGSLLDGFRYTRPAWRGPTKTRSTFIPTPECRP